MDILQRVRKAERKKILYLPHAIKQMSRPDRMISFQEVRKVVETGEMIEDYPEDPRGDSCLLLGFGEGNRAIHVVCAPKEEYLAIITAYLPDPDQWDSEFKTRE
jgi:hypothetical protein